MSDTRYCDAEYVSAYLLRTYGVIATEWSGKSANEQERLTEVGSVDLDHLYEVRMKGRRAARGQIRAYPRTGVIDLDGYLVDSTTAPVAVRDATAELCYLRVTGQMSGVLASEDNVRIRRERKKLGELEKEIEYTAAGKPATATGARTFPRVEAILRHLLDDVGGGSRMVVSLVP